MARWKLTEPHYLSVPGTEWEQVLTDRITQRPIRKKFPVPLHLDPRVESDWTHDTNGERPRTANEMDGSIIVCYVGKGRPGDIVFEGNPTPGMLPLDDEAREISARFAWKPTTDVTPEALEASHQSKILNNLIQQLADATVSGPAAPAGFEKFMETMAAMMHQQTMVLTQILGKAQEIEFQAQARAAGAEPAQPDLPLDEPEPPTEEELRKASEAAALREASSNARAQARVESRRV